MVGGKNECLPNYQKKTSHFKSQMWTSWLHYRKCQEITKVIRIRHLGTMNVYIIQYIDIIFPSVPKSWTDQLLSPESWCLHGLTYLLLMDLLMTSHDLPNYTICLSKIKQLWQPLLTVSILHLETDICVGWVFCLNRMKLIKMAPPYVNHIQHKSASNNIKY